MKNTKNSQQRQRGGTTEDYSKCILQTVSNLIENYSSFERVDEKEMVRQVKGNISNILTYRVAVNHCVVRKLEKDFSKPIYKLNCNIHPIDGISNNVNKLLRKQEQDKAISGKLFRKRHRPCCFKNEASARNR